MSKVWRYSNRNPKMSGKHNAREALFERELA